MQHKDITILARCAKAVTAAVFAAATALSAGQVQAYTLQHSTNPFTSIASTGNALGISNVDDSTESVNLGFNFDFYGTVVSSVRVSTNGLLNMDGNTNSYCCSASELTGDSSSRYGDVIAMLAEDLAPHSSSSARIFTAAGTGPVQSRIFEFSNVPFYYRNGSASFQAELFANGNIELRYGAVNSRGNLATVGVQSVTAGEFLQIGRQTGSNYANQSYLLSAASPAPVPLPASSLLLLGGVAGLAGLRMRRRNRPATA